MEKEFLTKNLEADILQKIKSIYALATQKESIHKECVDNFVKIRESSPDKGVEILNQAISDAILNSMATLIDYYCIYCMINIGIDVKRITRVQYRSIGKKFLIENSTLKKEQKEKFSLALLKQEYEKKLFILSKMEIDQFNPNDYWTGYLADAISTILNTYGILESKKINLDFDQSKNHLIINEKIRDYHHCMRFFYCNPSSRTGVRYDIYLDINNYLKHNSIPRVMRRIEEFSNPKEQRIYSFFEIENYKLIFLKDGFLRDILEIDFNTLNQNLKFKFENDNYKLCSLEEEWEIGPIIMIDRKNGFISKDGETLFFYIDSVLLAKTKTSILVDSESSFKSVLGSLIAEIEGKLQYFKQK